KSSSEDIASERGFVFFLLSAAFIIFLLAAALVAEAPLTPFRRLGGMMLTVQINLIHYDFPAIYIRLTIKPTRRKTLFCHYSHVNYIFNTIFSCTLIVCRSGVT